MRMRTKNTLKWRGRNPAKAMFTHFCFCKKLLYGHGRQFRYFINLTPLTQGDEENRTR